MLSGHEVGAPAQVADDIIKPRVMDVTVQRRAVDPALRWRRTRGAGLPRRNDRAAIGAEVHMAVCRRRSRREDILDRLVRRSVQRRAAACRGRVADGRPVALAEDLYRIAPRCTAIRRLAINGGGVTVRAHSRGANDEVGAVRRAGVGCVVIRYFARPGNVQVAVGRGCRRGVGIDPEGRVAERQDVGDGRHCRRHTPRRAAVGGLDHILAVKLGETR